MFAVPPRGVCTTGNGFCMIGNQGPPRTFLGQADQTNPHQHPHPSHLHRPHPHPSHLHRLHPHPSHLHRPHLHPPHLHPSHLHRSHPHLSYLPHRVLTNLQ